MKPTEIEGAPYISNALRWLQEGNRQKRANNLVKKLPKLVAYYENYVDAEGIPILDRDIEDAGLCFDIALVNDQDEITDKVREKKLTTLFKKAGIQISFID